MSKRSETSCFWRSLGRISHFVRNDKLMLRRITINEVGRVCRLMVVSPQSDHLVMSMHSETSCFWRSLGRISHFVRNDKLMLRRITINEVGPVCRLMVVSPQSDHLVMSMHSETSCIWRSLGWTSHFVRNDKLMLRRITINEVGRVCRLMVVSPQSDHLVMSMHSETSCFGAASDGLLTSFEMTN
jgi:hypothetical protein